MSGSFLLESWLRVVQVKTLLKKSIFIQFYELTSTLLHSEITETDPSLSGMSKDETWIDLDNTDNLHFVKLLLCRGRKCMWIASDLGQLTYVVVARRLN